jgi:hypothetical protein
MLPALERSVSEHDEARFVNHSSGARNIGSPDAVLERTYFEKRVGELGSDEGKFMRYHMRKLGNLTFTYALEVHRFPLD